MSEMESITSALKYLCGDGVVHFYVSRINDNLPAEVKEVIDFAISLKNSGREVILLTQIGWKPGRLIDEIRQHKIPLMSPNAPIMGSSTPVHMYLTSYWNYDLPDTVVCVGGIEATNGVIAAYDANIPNVVYVCGSDFPALALDANDGVTPRHALAAVMTCSTWVVIDRACQEDLITMLLVDHAMGIHWYGQETESMKLVKDPIRLQEIINNERQTI